MRYLLILLVTLAALTSVGAYVSSAGRSPSQARRAGSRIPSAVWSNLAPDKAVGVSIAPGFGDIGAQTLTIGEPLGQVQYVAAAYRPGWIGCLAA